MMENSKMPVKAYLILKVIKDKVIYVIATDGAELCNMDLSPDKNIPEQLAAELKLKYNLIYDWLDFQHVNTKIFNNHLGIFYSSFVPLDFIDEKNIKFIKDYSSIPIKISEEIQRSLRLSAY